MKLIIQGLKALKIVNITIILVRV